MLVSAIMFAVLRGSLDQFVVVPLHCCFALKKGTRGIVYICLPLVLVFRYRTVAVIAFDTMSLTTEGHHSVGRPH